MTQRWVTVSQACDIFGISRRTLSRWIQQDKIESKLDNNRRYILIRDEGHDETSEGQTETDVSQDMSQQVLIDQLEKDNKNLRQQIEYLKEQIQEKDKQLERQQIIIMQLSRDIESQQKLLEYKSEPFWRRWFRKNREV